MLLLYSHQALFTLTLAAVRAPIKTCRHLANLSHRHFNFQHLHNASAANSRTSSNHTEWIGIIANHQFDSDLYQSTSPTMENLTLEDPLQQGGAQPQMQNQMPLGGGVPPPNQQLPPQMFTTAAQLLDMTDSKD
jgi:hypothetical protein